MSLPPHSSYKTRQIHHTDAEREYAYERRAQFGKIDKAWDEAVKRWLVVDMKADWRTVFPFQH